MRAGYDPKWESGRQWLLQFYRGERPVIDLGCGRRPILKHGVTFDIYHGPDAYYTSELVDPNFNQSYEDLPFKDETISTVLSIDSIEHCTDPLATLNEWLRVLKPGGLLCLLVPDHRFTPERDEHPVEWTQDSFREKIISNLSSVEVLKDELVQDWWAGFILRKVS